MLSPCALAILHINPNFQKVWMSITMLWFGPIVFFEASHIKDSINAANVTNFQVIFSHSLSVKYVRLKLVDFCSLHTVTLAITKDAEGTFATDHGQHLCIYFLFLNGFIDFQSWQCACYVLIMFGRKTNGSEAQGTVWTYMDSLFPYLILMIFSFKGKEQYIYTYITA